MEISKIIYYYIVYIGRYFGWKFFRWKRNADEGNRFEQPDRPQWNAVYANFPNVLLLYYILRIASTAAAVVDIDTPTNNHINLFSFMNFFLHGQPFSLSSDLFISDAILIMSEHRESWSENDNKKKKTSQPPNKYDCTNRAYAFDARDPAEWFLKYAIRLFGELNRMNNSN